MAIIFLFLTKNPNWNQNTAVLLSLQKNVDKNWLLCTMSYYTADVTKLLTRDWMNILDWLR